MVADDVLTPMADASLPAQIAITDPQLGAWLQASGAAGRRVRVPMQLEPSGTPGAALRRSGTIGDHAGALDVELDDAGMGVALEDYIHARWPTPQPRYLVWLTGIWDEEDASFVVLAVGAPVDLRDRTAGLVASHELPT